MKKLMTVIFSLAFVMCLANISRAAVLDCTGSLVDGTAGCAEVFSGAFFSTTNFGASGTGLISSFVRVQSNGTEEGYNTSGRPVQYDENTSPQFTRDLLVSEVPFVTIDDIVYREFLLDVNQKANEGGTLLSLDVIRIYLEGVGGITNDGSFGTPIYELGANDWIKLDALFTGSGSGKADMFLYVPDSLFTGSNQFVYLYSQFGTNHATNDGFEEWAVFKCTDESVDCEGTPFAPVPEPMSMILFGSGLVGIAIRKKLS